ncbi:MULTISPECIES: HPF/RaiA family ribosome-associated protein [Pseudomonas]|jgi:ribosome-associated translation inhibitor RaiA|uniref:Ribosomal subunit interface protein n=1 Tax=Pseudomonas frederiksbergensis TaxID=104087 RepID=A0A0B1YXV1_9PSED|nr:MULTISPECIES: HPF/RaiA family ribosome-associated protein [Pseudomonas]KHK61992.1 ribosomal subunit interface protein [Pseudomonas frederiksbergensis]KJH86900.1 ribosomal subunit interface protein [Pseudomonas fluorescens]MBI6619812.1 HPF/RaiA family ribosome-associated protein [Pseudomonas corrugata]MBI6695532.1 HPF/RaiA family ribosome-associated protein [Pseudomonas corrugata]WRV70116.1 HPF/RaiA family ribosome-associated protein [Pseudomonas frederiksbergensis]
MQVQVNSNHIEGSARLQEWVGSTVVDALQRFEDHLSRVEIHVSDENAQKGGDADKRCQIEARLQGLSSMSVSHKAPSLELAVEGAAEKMLHALDHQIGKLNPAVESMGRVTAPVDEAPSQMVDAMLEEDFLENQEARGKE